MTETILHIVFNVIDEETEEAEFNCTVYGVSVIPPVGTQFIYYTVRDENGYYLNKNSFDHNERKVIDGIVEKIIFEIDERGWSEEIKPNLSQTLHVTLFVRGEPLNEHSNTD